MLDTENSFGNAEVIVGIATITLIIVLLGLIFRSPIASLLPIVSIGLVYALATSILALLAQRFGFNVDQSLTSLLIVVLFGIGTDYILFLLFRYRERLRAGDEPTEALRTSVQRVGEAITSSGLVVMAAMVALALSDLGSFRSMAPGFIVAVGTMLLASLTLIPALLSLIGPRVFWPSKRWQQPQRNRIYTALGRLIGRRPGLMALGSGALLVGARGRCLLPARRATTRPTPLPANTEAAKTFAQLKTAFPAGALNPTQVYVSNPGGVTTAQADHVAAALKRVNGVAAVASPALSPAGDVARIDVSLAANPTSTEALDLVSGPAARRRARGRVGRRQRARRRADDGDGRRPHRHEPRLRARLPGGRAADPRDPRGPCCAASSRRSCCSSASASASRPRSARPCSRSRA